MQPSHPVRKRLRYPGYDYSADGAYFVTICTHGRESILARIEDGHSVRTPAGQIVVDTWGKMALHHREIILDEYVVMPNHFHGILFVDGSENARDGHGPSPTVSLSYLMRELKTFSANKINRLLGTRGRPVWQRSYWERILRNDHELERSREYIRCNPANWESDREKLGQRLVGDGP